MSVAPPGAEPDHKPDVLTGALRMRRKRPGNGPAAEKCYERAPPHDQLPLTRRAQPTTLMNRDVCRRLRYDAFASAAPNPFGISMSTSSVDTDLPRSSLICTLSGSNGDVPADDGEDFLAQDAEQVGLVARPALVGEQDLQAFARNRRAAAASKQFEKAHAAFRPNSLLKMPLVSLGTIIGTTSPLSRRAASK